MKRLKKRLNKNNLSVNQIDSVYIDLKIEEV